MTTTCICELGMLRKADVVQLMAEYPELAVRYVMMTLMMTTILMSMLLGGGAPGKGGGG